jgi:hypothetical protein
MKTQRCGECYAIAREIADAYAEAWLSADDKFKAAWIARNRLIGGTEDDFLRAEELSRQVKSAAGSAKIGNAIVKMHAHQARTGHRVSWSGKKE